MFSHFLVITAAALAFVGNIPYLVSVLRKKVRPHPYSWFVWSIVSAVTLFGGIQKGAGFAAIAIAASEIFTILIFFCALYFGIRSSFKEVPKRDTLFLIISLIGLVPWIVTKDPTISVVVVVCIDLIAFVPTLAKTYRDPKSESAILFAMNVLRHVLILWTVSQYNIATTFHSIAMIITNSLMVCFIHRDALRVFFGSTTKD